MSKALLIVVTAPSGAGKSSLCDRLLSEFDDIVYSISCTTRSPRGDEAEGEDYFFLTEAQFEKNVAEDKFLEHAVVHDFRYGTLKDTVLEVMSEGNAVIMDIDVQGARLIREVLSEASDDDIMKQGFCDIFIAPPSIEELRDRLLGRGEDQIEVIERRLENAVEEMSCEKEFRYVIVNDDFETAYMHLRDVVRNAMD